MQYCSYDEEDDGDDDVSKMSVCSHIINIIPFSELIVSQVGHCWHYISTCKLLRQQANKDVSNKDVSTYHADESEQYIAVVSPFIKKL